MIDCAEKEEEKEDLGSFGMSPTSGFWVLSDTKAGQSRGRVSSSFSLFFLVLLLIMGSTPLRFSKNLFYLSLLTKRKFLSNLSSLSLKPSARVWWMKKWRRDTNVKLQGLHRGGAQRF